MAARAGSDTPRVEFEHVSKAFRYGVVHHSLRELLPDVARRLTGRAPARGELAHNAFWALRDVSFSVGPGEALGIIGPNGSGKSTALKLLTRVLEPTLGHCRITGRAGVLIELSAGFHPDLTGRENVYLQGQIMGMQRAEIARQFDRIVDFAGVARSIDTPVKRYSSGMTARLGFAIAAHLDPEVLIVDEALSVGDAAFQRKALDRVAEMVKRGTPVVMVTHQMEQVTALCTKVLVLEYGNVVAEGAPVACVETYLRRALHQQLLADSAIAVRRIELPAGSSVISGERLRLRLDTIVRHPERRAEHEMGLRVRSVASGSPVYHAALEATGAHFPLASEWFRTDVSLQLNVPPGPYHAEIVIRDRMTGRELALGPGTYIDVLPGDTFEGSVQLNMRCAVTHAEEHGPGNDFAVPGLAGLPDRT
jgi:ABC-type polysaccharide/polyol phosphate transport system ATPase subunit